LLEPLPASGHHRTGPERQLCEQALPGGGLQARGVQRLAVHLEDAAELAIALLGAWRAGVSVLLPADLQPQTRQRWPMQVDVAERSRRSRRAAAALSPAPNWISTSAA
jgi:non-ribosomal peptide synthetase component F